MSIQRLARYIFVASGHIEAYATNMNHTRWSWLPDPEALGRAVRDARRVRDLQQSDLAERLGVSRMTVSRLERGDSVSVDTALRALSECGLSIAAVPKFARIMVIDDG